MLWMFEALYEQSKTEGKKEEMGENGWKKLFKKVNEHKEKKTIVIALILFI